MNSLPQTPYNYQIGGSLPSNAPTYVTRQADQDLYQNLKKGNFCYVLNTRQMGKSSLRVQTMQRLQAEGVICAAIDLTAIGSQDLTPPQWYAGLLRHLVKAFALESNFSLRSWWRDNDHLSPVQRFSEFLETTLLQAIPGNIVIFIDEIDSTLSLPFQVDDFFAVLRYCYNQRSSHPHYQRLSFVLLGVASPSDLIQNKQRTAFNIGHPIALKGFQLSEATPLAIGLIPKTDHPEAVLEAILEWTKGQPFLTQKLCSLVIKSYDRIPPGQEAEKVEEVVQKRIIENWEAQDEPQHLGTIRDRLLYNEKKTGRLLGIYQHILHHTRIQADGSSEQSELILSGLVTKRNSYLEVHNQIYATIFNSLWVEEELAKLRPYSEALKGWLASEGEDESRLLRGQALQDALAWAASKSLSDTDYQFLTHSQELDKKLIQLTLEAQQKANQILTEAQQKAEAQLQEAKEGTALERLGISALRQFASSQLEALISAMETGFALKALVKDERPLQSYPASSPLLALQVILDNICERNQLSGHEGSVISLAFSPQGDYLASGSSDGTVILWDCSGKMITRLNHHTGSVTAVAFSAEGYLGTGDSEGNIFLWDLSRQIIAQSRHRQRVNHLCFSPNGQYLASASSDTTAILWDLSGQVITEFEHHSGKVNSIQFHPYGQQLLTASSDCTVRGWDLQGNQIFQLPHLEMAVKSAEFSPSGEFIVTTTGKQADLWEVSGKLIATLRGHGGGVAKARFSPNGERIATTSSDRTTRLWDLKGNPMAVFRHAKWGMDICFHPQDFQLVTACTDGKIYWWDLQKKHSPPLLSHQNWVMEVCFHPNGQQLATASWDTAIALWTLSGEAITTYKSELGTVNSLHFSPNGQYLVSAEGATQAVLRDLGKHSSIVLQGHEAPVSCVRFSPNGKMMATTSWDKTTRLWDLEGHLLTVFRGHQASVNSVSFHPNGKSLATGSDDEKIYLWDLSGKRIGEWQGNRGRVTAVCFSPQGDYLATASYERMAYVWDKLGQQFVRLIGHQAPVWAIQFSPDGQMVATGSSDGTARLWDLAGNQIAEFRGHESAIRSVCFSPNGKRLATASEDKTVRLWDIAGLDDLLGRGCFWLKDYSQAS